MFDHLKISQIEQPSWKNEENLLDKSSNKKQKLIQTELFEWLLGRAWQWSWMLFLRRLKHWHIHKLERQGRNGGCQLISCYSYSQSSVIVVFSFWIVPNFPLTHPTFAHGLCGWCIHRLCILGNGWCEGMLPSGICWFFVRNLSWNVLKLAGNDKQKSSAKFIMSLFETIICCFCSLDFCANHVSSNLWGSTPPRFFGETHLSLETTSCLRTSQDKQHKSEV